MGELSMLVEVLLVGLLGATLVYAVRLHRALGGLRREGGALAEAAAGFESGVSEAGAGLERMRGAAEGLASRMGEAATLKEDLALLSARGEKLADRLEALVRAGQGVRGPAEASGPVRSQAERNLVTALRGAR